MPFSHHLKTVRQYYEATAPDYREFWTGEEDLAMHFGYDDGGIRTHSSSLLRMNEVAARIASVAVNDRVLDAGCGCGGSAIWLAANIGCRVEGVNVVLAQLSVARKAAAKHRVASKVRFSNQDYCATSFQTASFDLVWALESVVHAEDKKAFAQEAARLLKKNGRLLMADLMLGGKRKRGQDKRVQKVERGWAISNLLTPGSCRSLFLNTGFTDVRLCDWTKNVQPSVKRLADICRRALPKAKAKLSAREWNQTRFENIVACIYIDELLEEGTLKYMMMTAHKR